MSKTKIPLSKAPAILAAGDPGWPGSLSDLPDPPLWLRVAGELPLLQSAVAIVGTRYADEEALHFTRELARDLSLAGLTVISGGARGIDAAAHQGALEGSGRTVAVLATGLLKAYPAGHGPLFGRIAEKGALVTEAEDDQAPWPSLFLRRNRLIAALAESVIVVQAPLRSGALSTAGWAKRLRRPLLAVPAAPWETRGKGCVGLLRDGAKVCTSARDVLSVRCPTADLLVPEPPKARKSHFDLARLDDDERGVLTTLARYQRYPDEIARKLDLPAARVQRTLLRLKLQGMVKELQGGKYARTFG